MKNSVRTSNNIPVVQFAHAPAGSFCKVVSVDNDLDISWMVGMIAIRPNGTKQHAILLNRTCHHGPRLLGILDVQVIPKCSEILITVGEG